MLILVAPAGSSPTPDYNTLGAAVSNANNNDEIKIYGAWSTKETRSSTINITVNTLRIYTEDGSDARHPGWDDPNGDHYVIDKNAGAAAHVFTTTGSGGANHTFEGFVIKQSDSDSSDEGIRAGSSTSNTITCKNMIFDGVTDTDQQDGIYCSPGKDTTINLEQCYFYRWGRAGVHLQLYNGSGDTAEVNVNSCGFWENAQTTGYGGGIRAQAAAGQTTIVNAHNTWCIDNDGAANAQDYSDGGGGGGTDTWNISNCVDSDNSIASRRDTGANNFASYSIEDADSPGAGDWVLVEDITTNIDLRLRDSPNNDVIDKHSNDTAHNLTIPSYDIAGTARAQPQPSGDHDIGPFEVVSGGGAGVSCDSAETVLTAAAAQVDNTTTVDCASSHNVLTGAHAQVDNTTTVDCASAPSVLTASPADIEAVAVTSVECTASSSVLSGSRAAIEALFAAAAGLRAGFIGRRTTRVFTPTVSRQDIDDKVQQAIEAGGVELARIGAELAAPLEAAKQKIEIEIKNDLLLDLVFDLYRDNRDLVRVIDEMNTDIARDREQILERIETLEHNVRAALLMAVSL